MSDIEGTGELALEFLALNESLRASRDRTYALQRLVDLAVTSLAACDWAAVTTWPRRRSPHSLAYSADIALQTDQLQYEVNEGPCLTAAADGITTHLADTDTDQRWPQFSTAVRAHSPVRSVLSFHIADDPDSCALNLYSGRPSAFTSDATAMAALFAAHARVLLLHADSTDKATQLSQALTTSRQIGAAIGILMTVYRVSADEAFGMLRRTSQNLNRKLRVIAEDVTHTGQLPD